MTLSEFTEEIAEVYQIFSRPINDALNKRLFQKLEGITVFEFRSIKARIFNEYDFIPKLNEWHNLRSWILSKRPRYVSEHESIPCPKCLGSGEMEAICKVNLYSDEWFNKFSERPWEDHKNQGEVFLERQGGKDTTGMAFSFICTCENGKRYKGKAQTKWRVEFLKFYEPKFLQTFIPTKDQIEKMKKIGIQKLIDWTMCGKDIALEIEMIK